ncbi:MAG TPA: hypothetical protein VK699_16740 [Terriglobales bacterium]|jgi:hypothetical protein|nr:hypothetical protein [Terriglobales bacterium]
MKSKNINEYKEFENLLGSVLKVPHSEIKKRLETEGHTKKQKPKKASVRRASGVMVAMMLKRFYGAGDLHFITQRRHPAVSITSRQTSSFHHLRAAPDVDGATKSCVVPIS